MPTVVNISYVSAFGEQIRDIARRVLPINFGETLEGVADDIDRRQAFDERMTLLSLRADWSTKPTILSHLVDLDLCRCEALTVEVVLPVTLRDSTRLLIANRLQQRLTNHIQRDIDPLLEATVNVT